MKNANTKNLGTRWETEIQLSSLLRLVPLRFAYGL